MIDCLTRKGFEHPPFRFTTGPDAVIAASLRLPSPSNTVSHLSRTSQTQAILPSRMLLALIARQHYPIHFGPDIDATSRSRLTATDLPDSSRSLERRRGGCRTAAPTRMRLLAIPLLPRARAAHPHPCSSLLQPIHAPSSHPR